MAQNLDGSHQPSFQKAPDQGEKKHEPMISKKEDVLLEAPIVASQVADKQTSHQNSPNIHERKKSTLSSHVNEIDSQSSSVKVTPKEVDPNTTDIVMCGALTAHSDSENDTNWVPPCVEKELSYPSDEEIVPNPKTVFTKQILPKFEKVRGWFRSIEKEANDDGSTSLIAAPCLANSSDGGFPSKERRILQTSALYHPYTELTARLPQNIRFLEQIASRPGIGTRLKVIASQRVSNAREDGYLTECTDDDSSSSLQFLPNHPDYPVLASSIFSDDEGMLGDQNTGPAHVTSEATDVLPGTGSQALPAIQIPPGTGSLTLPAVQIPPGTGSLTLPAVQISTDLTASSRDPELEERLRSQQRQLDNLHARFDQLFDILTGTGQGGQPPPASPVVDPQIA